MGQTLNEEEPALDLIMNVPGRGGAKQHTQSPIVTGSSVIGIKYADGVVLAADTLTSYGSLARFRDMERLAKVGDQTVVGISRACVEKCMRVLFYRDARTINRIQIATVNADGVSISEPFELETNWDLKSTV